MSDTQEVTKTEASETPSPNASDHLTSAEGTASVALPAILAGGIATTPVTRIGRPCNNIPKPAVPRQNAAGFGGKGTMTSASSIRDITDELARRRISDLKSPNGDALSYYDAGKWSGYRKFSNGSVLSDSSRRSSSDDLGRKKSSDGSLSIDSLGDHWKFLQDPRRSSDASVILTQDTDSFIIGERVWVGGTKAGQIAYIGETQFAPGEWAGVVLDEPIGKNDGSVANIRYFQCEPKKGIFSRLTRLTRYPLAVDSSEHLTSPHAKNAESLANKSKKPLSPIQTPTTPPAKSAYSKPSSPDSSIHPNVSVGDRVIVMSSQGSKAGVLRFLGATDFAPGEWCGVELDDPVGKNDGSVAGTRYFECRPKFGLFAPLHKVSKSPANRRPSQASCQIHRGGGTVGIRRQGSKESLASMSSMGSTTASVRSTARKVGVRTPTTPTSTKNALQDILKEKEAHIGLLLKERDLERAEVIRAASQADEAEKKLVMVQQEFQQRRDEAEAQIADLDAMVCLLKAENEEISSQLEDEKRKHEDFQFRFEEVSIEKGDLVATVKTLEEKISVLEKNSADERKRVEVLELESNKLFEAEEQLVALKEENDALREKIAEYEKASSAVGQEKVSLEATATMLRAEVQSLKEETQEARIAASRGDADLRENLSQVLQKLESAERGLSVAQAELDRTRKDLESRSEAAAVREKELSEKHSTFLRELQGKHDKEITDQSKRLEEIQANYSVKVKVLEEKLDEKIKMCNELEIRLQEVNMELSKAKTDKLIDSEKQQENERRLVQDLIESSEQTKQKTADLEAEKEKSRMQREVIEELKKEVEKAEEKLGKTSKSNEIQMKELTEKFAAQKIEMSHITEKLTNITMERDALKQSFDSVTAEYEVRIKDFNVQVKDKESIIDRLTTEMETMRQCYELKNNEQKKIGEVRDKDFESKFKQIQMESKKREIEISSLRSQLEQRNATLAMKDTELENEKKSREDLALKLTAAQDLLKLQSEKKNLMLEAGDSNQKLVSIEEKLMLAVEQKENLEGDLANFINSKNDTSAQLSALNGELRLKEKEIDRLRDELRNTTLELKLGEQELRQELEWKKSEVKTIEEKLAEAEKNSHQRIEELQTELKNAATRAQDAETEWKNKMETSAKETKVNIEKYETKIGELQKSLNEKTENEDHLKKTLEEIRKTSKEKLKTMEKELLKAKETFEKMQKEFFIEKKELNMCLEEAREESLRHVEELTEKAKIETARHRDEKAEVHKALQEACGKLQAVLSELEEIKKDRIRIIEEKTELEKSKAILQESMKEKENHQAELETRITSIEKEKGILKDSLSQLREEKWSVDKGNVDNALLITELRGQLKTAEEWKKKFEEDMEVHRRHKDDLLEQLKMSEQSHKEEKAQMETVMSKLRTEIDLLKKDSHRAAESSRAEIDAAGAALGELKCQLEARKLEMAGQTEEIAIAKEKADNLEKELAEEKKKTEKQFKSLEELKREKMELEKRVEEQEKILIEKDKVRACVDDLTKMAKDGEEAKMALSKVEESKETLAKRLSDSEALLAFKEKTLETLSNELETLKKERANLLNNNRIAVESLEKEKTLLQTKIAEMKNESSSVHDNDLERNRRQAEEREFTQGQVDFLNSVIVDMQKKNDALKARIEVLEMGFSPEDVEDFTLETIKRTTMPPRLFCDICDVFDLHDTEDCPTQAMDEEEPLRRSGKGKSAPPPERPYCDICEVFGHDTSNCDDAEMF